MKAVRIHRRGGPEQLVYEEAPTPKPSDGEALIRVHAAGVTPTELSWDPTYTSRDGSDRLPAIPGHELSGVVEALGPGVADVSVGQEVYALIDFWRDGADAEHVVASSAVLATKPARVGHAQAAAASLSALTAWQALFEHGNLQRGQRVLIHGGAGGVGGFAVQLARWRRAHVIATTSAENVELVRDMGADEVIDYRARRFEEAIAPVDLVLDTVAGETLDRSWSVLKKGGTLVSVAGSIDRLRAEQAQASGVFFIVEPSRADLLEIARLIDAGTIKVLVADVLPLSSAREAFERGLRGHNRGKLVLSVPA